VRVADPLKLSAQAFVACHDIVKGENDECGKMFLFFPTCCGLGDRPGASTQGGITTFSRKYR
jgi:hypothetical protein